MPGPGYTPPACDRQWALIVETQAINGEPFRELLTVCKTVSAWEGGVVNHPDFFGYPSFAKIPAGGVHGELVEECGIFPETAVCADAKKLGLLDD